MGDVERLRLQTAIADKMKECAEEAQRANDLNLPDADEVVGRNYGMILGLNWAFELIGKEKRHER